MFTHNVYLGYDAREDLAYRVAEHSILSRTGRGINIFQLRHEMIPFLDRPIEWRVNENGVRQMWCPISEAPMSTAFAISRFAVPFLQRKGWSLFADSDIVCLTDLRTIFDHCRREYAVMVVKHQHIALEKYHDAGQLQTFYARKNWSSVVLWNHDHEANERFTIADLNTRPGRDLHAFYWLKDEEIGELPQEWNYLVGVNEHADLRQQKIVHYTNGQPGWAGWVPQETDYLFNEELEKMSCVQV